MAAKSLPSISRAQMMKIKFLTAKCEISNYFQLPPSSSLSRVGGGWMGGSNNNCLGEHEEAKLSLSLVLAENFHYSLTHLKYLIYCLFSLHPLLLLLLFLGR
jgi:hypothetical protein